MDAGGGSYTASYTPTTSGTDNVAITLNGAAINGSPISSAVSPGAASTATSLVGVSAGSVISGNAITVTLQARDANNNAVPGLSNVAFTQTGAGSGTFGGITEVTPGSYQAGFTGILAGNVTVGATIGGSAVTSTQAVTVTAASQTITFAQPTTPATFGTSFLVAPTASSGLAVSVSATGGCSNVGNNVTMTSGTTDCTITASQAGNGSFAPAPDVVRTVGAAKATQTITFAQPNAGSATFGQQFIVAPTSNSGLAVAVAATGGCTIASGTVTMTSGTADCTLTASQAGNADYLAATNVVQIVTALRASQTITFTAPVSSAAFQGTFAIAPTASSNLAVSVLGSGGCTLNTGTVTMTSGSVDCTLTASQAGNTDYLPATNVVVVVTATKAAQTITFAQPTSPAEFNSQFTVGPTASSGLGVLVAAANGCTIASGSVIMTSGTNDCVLTASQPGDADWAAATDVVRTVNASKANQTITFGAPASPATFGTSFTPSATSSSNLAVAFAASGGCTITAGTATMTSGTTACTLTASQAGNADYNAAADVVQVVTAAKADQTITFPPTPASAVFGTTFTITAPTSSSGLAVTVSAAGGCTIAGLDVTMTSGTTGCDLTASQAGNADYNAAPNQLHNVGADRADQTINFLASPASAAFGTTFGATATATSGLPVNIGAAGGCTINAGTVTMTSGSVDCTLTATQAGTADYKPAPDVVHTITATKASQTIDFPASPASQAFGTTFAAAATASSNLTVSIAATGGCTITTGTVTMTSGTTDCTLTATQAGDANYLAATDVVHTVTAQKANQTITFTTPASAVFGTSFLAAPTASSNLAVTVTPAGGCTILGNTITMTSGTTACSLTASQAGNVNYNAAPDEVRSVTAQKAAQAPVTLVPPANDSIGAPNLQAVATGGSGTGAFSYASSTQAICTIDANTGAIAALDVGTCSLQATRAGDADYLPETSPAATFDVLPGHAAVITRLSLALQPGTVGQAVGAAPSVRVTDVHGAAVPNVSVEFLPSHNGSVTGSPATTNALGIATVGSWTLGTQQTGNQNLVARVTGAVDVTFSANASPDAPANVIAFTGDNQTAVVNTPVATALQVIVEDQYGNRVPGVNVTFTPTANSGTVTGSPALTDGSGVAALGSWRLGRKAEVDILTATSNGHSVDFHATAVPDTPAQLLFTAQPQNGIANTDMAPFVVTAEDQFDNVTTNYAGTVTLTFRADPTGGLATITNGSVSLVAGVATFSTVRVDQVADNYRFDANITALGLTSVSPSDRFDMAFGAVSQLVFSPNTIQQVSNTIAGQGFPNIVTVRALDAFGNLVTTYGGNATIAIEPGTGTAGASLTGPTSFTFGAISPGEALFSGAGAIDSAGTGYRIRVTSGALTSVLSATFDVAPGSAAGTHSTIQASPATISLAGAGTVTITLTAHDGLGNRIHTGGATVVFSLSNGAGESQGTLGTLTDNNDGTYTVVFTPTQDGTAVTVSATIDGDNVANTATITVGP